MKGHDYGTCVQQERIVEVHSTGLAVTLQSVTAATRQGLWRLNRDD
jgi:hypothetical protein